jgi:hypothetical protein
MPCAGGSTASRWLIPYIGPLAVLDYYAVLQFPRIDLHQMSMSILNTTRGLTVVEEKCGVNRRSERNRV